MAMKPRHHFNLWYAVFAFLVVLLLQDYVARFAQTRQIAYSDFLKAVAEDRVTDVVAGTNRINGKIKLPGEATPVPFTTVRVDDALATRLENSHVGFSGEPPPGIFQTLLSWILPSAIFIGLWMLISGSFGINRAGGLLSIGKSRAKVFVEKSVAVTFADVAGVDEAKEELREIVEFLKDPTRYGRLGAHIPKGILLVGPPGTGKTLLARALAGEAGVPFFSISGSEFVELFVGVGAARVRDLFAQAREHAPAIIFIDELDALGRARGAFFGGGHDEKEQTLNQLLSEMDGFDTSSGVVLLAATNRPEILDPALLRAGRFDRQVLVDRPDKAGRADILRVHVKAVKLAPKLKLDEIAALTPGFTGADLANLVNEATLLATRRGAGEVSLDDFTVAIERIVAGLEKRKRLLSPHERAIIAHHEVGHALVAMALPGSDPIQKISIIPRGIAALGYTMQRPMEDRFLHDRGELLDKMAVLLGGRAAERLIFGEVSTGAADDLTKATEIARSMITRFGMDPELGDVSYEPDRATFVAPIEELRWQPRQYSSDTAAKIDKAVQGLIAQALKRAADILSQNHALLTATAEKLLKEETLQGEALSSVAKTVRRLNSQLKEAATA
jgi:cell division protease FtsH